MKLSKIFVLLLIIAFLVPTVAAANDWDEYLKLRSQYYNLDEQDFNTITCSVDLDLLNKMLAALDQQLSPLKDNLSIVKDMDNFTLVYSKANGLKLNRPTLDIIITSDEGLADPERAKKGINMIKMGFDTMLSGIEMELSGIFDEYVTPSKEDFDDFVLTPGEGEYAVSYSQKGSSTSMTIKGATTEITIVDANSKSHIIAAYEKSDDGKLILNKADSTVKQPVGDLTSTLLLIYQKVGSVTFPKSITSSVVQVMQGVRQEGQTTVTLTDCKAE